MSINPPFDMSWKNTKVQIKITDTFHYTISSFYVFGKNDPPYFVTPPKDLMINVDELTTYIIQDYIDPENHTMTIIAT
jgi:hypothetical protein